VRLTQPELAVMVEQRVPVVPAVTLARVTSFPFLTFKASGFMATQYISQTIIPPAVMVAQYPWSTTAVLVVWQAMVVQVAMPKMDICKIAAMDNTNSIPVVATVATALMEEPVASVATAGCNFCTRDSLLILNTTLLPAMVAQCRCSVLAERAVRQVMVALAATVAMHMVMVTHFLTAHMVTKVAQVVMLVMAELLVVAVMAVSNILIPTNKL
jgi:hypothetical protein